MTKREFQLEKQVAMMEADIKVTSMAFGGLLKKLGIDTQDFSGKDKDAIMKKTPTILKNISKAVLTQGDSFGQALNNAIAVGPVMKKYEYLFQDDKIEQNGR